MNLYTFLSIGYDLLEEFSASNCHRFPLIRLGRKSDMRAEPYRFL